MTPREFLSHYGFDDRMVTGAFYGEQSVRVAPGDTVGVVLFNLGGPSDPSAIEPFLYNLFMDPAIIDIPVPAWVREPLCRFIARKRAAGVRDEYELIGGRSPIIGHTNQQASLLQKRLNDELTGATGASYRVYQAMRYAPPLTEEAIRAMDNDGVDKVVLLPLYPQYSKTTTGASLAYWHALEQAGELSRRPTALIREYATHPALVRCISERIDEGLSRFPPHVRNRVHLLFSAHGTPLYEMTKRKDPYCCLIHATVDAVMSLRSNAEAFSVAFQSKVGPAKWLAPSTPDRLETLASEGVRDVLVIPVAFVSDHVETAFELDMEVRAEAEHAGIVRYEVMTGLNAHALFIETLFDLTAIATGAPRTGGALDLESLTRADPLKRRDRCERCPKIAEAVCWPAKES